MKRFIDIKLTLICILTSLSLIAYSQDKNDPVFKAFSDSYISEYAGKYEAAINSLKKVYDEKSYEINLRLGWLHYSAGLFNDAATYYNKAASILPMSIEAKFGAILPLAALGKWDPV